MLTNLQFILVPLVASILLLAITCYFGIHVLKREIIFIDIALAQIAVLGGVVVVYLEEALQLHGIMIGERELAGILESVFSLLFCLGAALLFAFLKNPRIKIPIEAFIGIAYAFATTAAVIILDKGAGGDVHLHDMLTGVLLWTTWPQVLRLAVVLAVVGGFHVLFRKKFIRLSDHDHLPPGSFPRQRLWDFLFYFTFGIMIIEAVKIAGVLTVFAFLIIPASVSALFSGSWRNRILIGIGTGLVASVLGLHFSITLDLTASPLIILFLGILLLIGFVARRFMKGRHSAVG